MAESRNLDTAKSISIIEEEESQAKPMQLDASDGEDILAYVSQPTQKQSTGINHLQNLFNLNDSISQKMDKLAELNEQFFQKQEKLFLKTFVNMMDRMSNELLQARQKYNNIDEEIQQLPECRRMREKMNFYREECLFLKNQVKRQRAELEQLKKKNQLREGRLEALNKDLYREASRSASYKKRKYSLKTRVDATQNKDHFKSFLTNGEPQIHKFTTRPQTQRYQSTKPSDFQCESNSNLKPTRNKSKKRSPFTNQSKTSQKGNDLLTRYNHRAYWNRRKGK